MPTRTTLTAAIHSGIITATDVVAALKALPAATRGEEQREVMDIMEALEALEALEAKIGAVL